MTGGNNGIGDLVSAVLCFSTGANHCVCLQNATLHQATASMEDALGFVPPSLPLSIAPTLILSPLVSCSPSHPHCLPFLSPSARLSFPVANRYSDTPSLLLSSPSLSLVHPLILFSTIYSLLSSSPAHLHPPMARLCCRASWQLPCYPYARQNQDIILAGIKSYGGEDAYVHVSLTMSN